jgi:hypothetical protein
VFGFGLAYHSYERHLWTKIIDPESDTVGRVTKLTGRLRIEDTYKGIVVFNLADSPELVTLFGFGLGRLANCARTWSDTVGRVTKLTGRFIIGSREHAGKKNRVLSAIT